MKYFFNFLFLTAFAIQANAQIVFNSDDFLTMSKNGQTRNTYTSTDLTGLATIVTTTGANVNWSLADRSFTLDNTVSGMPILKIVTTSTPFSTEAEFSGATHFERKEQSNATKYTFYKVNSDGFFIMGEADDSTNGVKAKVFILTPPAQFIKFPLTYGTTWSSTSSVTGTMALGMQGASWVQSGNCDGWGTLTTPSSISKKNQPTASGQALRIKSSQQIGTTFMGTFYGFTTKQIQFFSQDNHSMVISTDDKDVPTKVNYSVTSGSTDVDEIKDDFFNISISENPLIGSRTDVLVNHKNPGNLKVSMMDALGREVITLGNGFTEKGLNSFPIDASNLARGTYFIRVNADGMTATRKLIITK